MARQRLGLFSGYGIELEYMIVDRERLDVLPVADRLLTGAAGEVKNERRHGPLRVSNELVLHVIEMKTNGPAPRLDGVADLMQEEIGRLNEQLAPLGGCLLPGAMHPWMDPHTQTRIWPHDNGPIYATYNRIFDCRGHGWSNLQSTHLNLPFASDEEFGRLHAAIRLILPILPALAASSPFREGKATGLLDTRLDVYRRNQERIPAIAGRIIPEAVFSRQAYRKEILRPMYREIAPHDPDKILQEEWLNSRGAIARFTRNAIEIRLLDVQETPYADLAIIGLIVALLQGWTGERHTPYAQQQVFTTEALRTILDRTMRDADQAVIEDAGYCALFGAKPGATAGELWQSAAARLNYPLTAELEVIFREGPLARRLLKRAGTKPDREELREVYRTLASCMAEGKQLRG